VEIGQTTSTADMSVGCAFASVRPQKNGMWTPLSYFSNLYIKWAEVIKEENPGSLWD
jgi:hypothetical protein